MCFGIGHSILQIYTKFENSNKKTQNLRIPINNMSVPQEFCIKMYNYAGSQEISEVIASVIIHIYTTHREASVCVTIKKNVCTKK